MSLPALVGRKPPAPEISPSALMMERHFSVQQLADKWGLSYDFVLEHFRDEPGVVVTGPRNTRKRRRGTVRIPESVAVRVYSQMVVGA